jgi:hypothetical protein
MLSICQACARFYFIPAFGDFRRKASLAFVWMGSAKKTLFEGAVSDRVRFRGGKDGRSFTENIRKR